MQERFFDYRRLFLFASFLHLFVLGLRPKMRRVVRFLLAIVVLLDMGLKHHLLFQHGLHLVALLLIFILTEVTVSVLGIVEQLLLFMGTLEELLMIFESAFVSF